MIQLTTQISEHSEHEEDEATHFLLQPTFEPLEEKSTDEEEFKGSEIGSHTCVPDRGSPLQCSIRGGHKILYFYLRRSTTQIWGSTIVVVILFICQMIISSPWRR